MDVLVIGGGGALGRLVCSQLTARGHRALAIGRRDGNLRDPALIARAGAPLIINCAGASVQMGLGHGWRGYRAVDVPIGLAAVEAARRTKARLVYVGVHHPPALRATAYVDAHERVAEAMADIDGAVVRPTGFFSAISGAFLPMAKRGRMFDVGDGSARTNPICERDLAEIVVDVALGGDGPRDVSVGGPEVMTRREMLERVASAAGYRANVTGMPLALCKLNAALLRAVHPRMGQFVQFVVGLAQHDVIAPACGTTKLGDYVASLPIARAA
ncbi:MAG TPA: NAD-dependent epimerase/dehydratase family protein [Kofleriaceae bacterium]|nr:NAD-dependent epimerase/dehydratase family protein [Kofleriaceae bacterium]